HRTGVTRIISGCGAGFAGCGPIPDGHESKGSNRAAYRINRKDTKAQRYTKGAAFDHLIPPPLCIFVSVNELTDSVSAGSARPYPSSPFRLRYATRSVCRNWPTGLDLSTCRSDYRCGRPYHASRTLADTERGI